MLIKFGLDRLAPAGAAARLTVLLFHRVLERPDSLLPSEPDAAEFDVKMRWIASWFNVLPLAEAVERLTAGTLPARALAVTFDDGYADNHRVAMPILRRHGLTATFFVASGFLDGGRMWNDSVIETIRGVDGPVLDLRSHGLSAHDVSSAAARARSIEPLLASLKHLAPGERAQRVADIAAHSPRPLPRDLMMTVDQVRDLVRHGMTVGAHTVSHPILRTLPLEAARREIVDGRAALENIIGEPVRVFAYPNGKPIVDYGPEHVELVRAAGFAAAVSTAWGAAGSEVKRFEIPRFTPWDRTRFRYAARLARNYFERIRCTA